MFADVKGDDGLMNNGTHEGVFFFGIYGHTMRAVATAFDLSGPPVIRLSLKPFLLGHNKAEPT